MKRRSFLKFMGVAPLGAKQISESLAKNELKGQLAASGIAVADRGNPVRAPYDHQRKMLGLVKRFGMPDWMKEEIRRDNDFVGCISIDIVTLKSPSLAGKVQMQRRRQIRRAEEKFFDTSFEDLIGVKDAWLKKMGFGPDPYEVQPMQGSTRAGW